MAQAKGARPLIALYVSNLIAQWLARSLRKLKIPKVPNPTVGKKFSFCKSRFRSPRSSSKPI